MKTLLSWNVNGMRAILRNGFMDWLSETRPEILCVQECRACEDDLCEEELRPFGYHSFWHSAAKHGYAGTAVFAKTPPKNVRTIGLKRFDNEGRLQALEFDDFVLLNGYWPNSQAKRARLPYKLDFCRALTRFANTYRRAGCNVLLCGDFNIAHQPIDLARPKANENNAGYYIEEREAMARFLKHGYVDTFRRLHPKVEKYSWWSYRTGARERNIGWRIDYWCVSRDFMPRVQDAFILDDVLGSDHCPVGITID